jgi:hypothetical protein
VGGEANAQYGGGPVNAPSAEVIAQRASDCRGCSRQIEPGDAIVAVPHGWMHADCGANYQRIRQEHGEVER